MFDCVMPTRNARNGQAFTGAGKRASSRTPSTASDPRPLDGACALPGVRRAGYSRAYLRHLFVAGEILAARLLTQHNLTLLRAAGGRGARAALASNYAPIFSGPGSTALSSGTGAPADNAPG